jgi:uncharacterized damage-inducible protein DinB
MRNHWLALSVCTLAAVPLAGAESGFHSEYLDELQAPSEQVIQLAEAVPAEKYSWRPGPGVRSLSEVYAHLALANFLLLDMAGVKPPADLFPSLPEGKARSQSIVNRNAQLEKTITEKRQVIDLLKRSFAAVHDSFSQANEAKLNQPADFFGSTITVRAIYLRILVHDNEHMGQSVAYARMNGVVPPWSK